MIIYNKIPVARNLLATLFRIKYQRHCATQLIIEKPQGVLPETIFRKYMSLNYEVLLNTFKMQIKTLKFCLKTFLMKISTKYCTAVGKLLFPKS